MPLVRFELKNEYGLGDPRLYQGAPKEEEDPRNILAGVTVSGLVGILRQLGDLADLAAVVFHDVHEQVMTTAARGHKVLNRIKKIEATLPQFEKAVQEQKSHIHFAYITGCNWHANIQTGQSQLVFSDLPEFMLDSYEECRDPPRLHLLDKFDSAGSGACLKRYSDPSYFRMLMARSDSAIVEKAKSGMKVQKKKRQRSKGMHGLARHSINMTLHGRSNMQFASLVPDGLCFSVDDGSISDTLSISGLTTELTYFSSDKRSDCLKVQNSPSPMSKKMYDGVLTTDAKTTQKVDCIFNNDNKVTASDYVIQDSLHQQNDVFSSSISCDEQTEIFKSISQIPCHDLPVDGLNPKAAEISCSLSNKNHLNDCLGMQGERISRSLTWDDNATDNPEIQDKSASSVHSAASNEQAEIIESSSSKSPDGIIHYRPPDLDLLFVTLETSNRQSDMDDNEMHEQENVLLDTIKMAAPSIDGSQISELTSQLYKHMDATDALDSTIKTNFGYHTGQEVILLPHLNYNGMECVINNSLVTTPSLDGVDSGIAHEACNSLKRNYSLQVIFDHLQLSGPAESESRLLYSVENAITKSLTCDSTMKNDSEGIHSAPCLRDIVPITQGVAIDEIPPEDSLCQDSFGDKSAKIVREKEGISEHRTKQKLEPTADSNCQGTESHCSTEKMIAASKLDCLDSETHVVSCSSASCPGVIIPSTQAVFIDGVPPEESFSQDYFVGTSAKSTSEKELFCERQIKQETESTEDSNCQGNEYQSSMEKVIAASNFDDSHSETHAASTNRDPCPGFVFPNTLAMVIDGIPPEESLSQDSLGDTSAKTASEQEVLCEHQSKQGKELMTNSNFQGTEHEINTEKVIAASKFDVPNSESHVTSCDSSDAYASPILCGLIISNNVDNISSSTLGSDLNSSRCPVNISSPRNDSEDSLGNVSAQSSNKSVNLSSDVTASEDPLGNVTAQSSNKSVILSSDVTASTTVVSRGFPVDSFRKSSINIWTNGGLLGLEPSKPPDISVPNAYSSDDIYDDRSVANSQPHDLGSGNESRNLFADADKLNLISFPEQDNIMGKISNEQSDSVLSKQRSKASIQASSFWKIAKAQNAYFSEIDGVQGKNGGTFSSEDDIYTKNGSESTVSRQNNIGMSVGFASLAHRFLVSSLQRKSPMSGIAPLFELMNNDVHKLHGTKIHSKDKERPKLAISLAPLHKLGNNEDSEHAFSEKLVAPSFDSSGYQSPPLEHMKVSFQTMNDTDVSKLNLVFPSSQQQGNMENAMFPSFQLLTESFQPLSDGALESDDDTFCRSCPYSSDDLLTLHSESDAEIWGEDEIDFSCRIEATGSISNSNEFNDCNACRVSQINDVANLKHGSDEQSLTHVT